MRTLKPDLSRVVHYRPSQSCGLSDAELHHAVIIRVLSDSLVNLLVTDGNNGSQVFKQAVRLYGPDEPKAGEQLHYPYCCWPDAVVRMERSAADLEKSFNTRGYTLEEVARGDQKRDFDAGVTRSPVNADGSPIDPPPAATPKMEAFHDGDGGVNFVKTTTPKEEPAASEQSTAGSPDVETSSTAEAAATPIAEGDASQASAERS